MKYFKLTKKIFIPLFLLLFFGGIYVNNFILAENSLFNRLRGKILLQVEENGEAWYLNPLTNQAYFLGRPEDAFSIMKSSGIGISNLDIEKIPISLSILSGTDFDNDGLPDALEDAIGANKNNPDTDKDGFNDFLEIENNFCPKSSGKMPIDLNFSQKQAGKILIQAEQNGEAWYLNPDDNKRYFLGRPQDAFALMRKLGLGISNQDFKQIPKFDNSAIFEEEAIESNNKIGELFYYDNNYNYSFEYPKNFNIKKYSSHDNIVFLGDYQEKPLEEKKSLITIINIKPKAEISLADFKIASKQDAVKNSSQEKELENKKALEEIFEYTNINAYEISTIIQKGPNEFLQINLITGGSKAYYTNIYNNIIQSLEFDK